MSRCRRHGERVQRPIWHERADLRGRTNPALGADWAHTVKGSLLGNHYVLNRSVLVAVEPYTYRDAIAASLALLRPGANVVVVDPADLAAALVSHHPALVILSDPASAVGAEVPA